MRIEEIIFENFPEAEKRNQEIRVNCPFCPGGDTKKHLYINPYKRVVHCFKCGYSKVIGKFLADIGQGHLVSKELLTGVMSEEKTEKEETKNGDILGVKTITWPQFFKFLYGSKSWVAEKVIEYLQSRNVTMEQIREYRIGYCYRGRYAGRVIFPCFMGGNLVYYVARSIFPTEKKILNPPSEVALRRGVIFNYDRARMHKEIVICEGVFDALSIGDSAVALLGKQATEEQIINLVRMGDKKFVICLDADAYKDSFAIAERIASYGRRVYIAKLEEGDPNSVNKKYLQEVIKRASEFSLELMMENV